MNILKQATSDLAGLTTPTNDALESDISPISDFYAGKSILITGATGFIGKVRATL